MGSHAGIRHPARGRAVTRLTPFNVAACVIALLPCPGCTGDQTAETEIVIQDAWIRAPVPPFDKTAGYFHLANGTDKPVTLTSVSSPRARSIEFHETTEQDGMLRMRRLKEVVIDPGASIDFQPGGKHLMVFGFSEGGDRVPVTFRFEDGTSIDASLELR